MIGARPVGCGVLALALLLAGPGIDPAASGAAQEAVPLTKSDLTRMVVRGTYSPEEVERIVRRSCLSFDPTDRDLEDLRRVGAADGILEAVEFCRRGGALTVRLATPEITAPAGSTAQLNVELRRGDRPAAGVRVRLAGSGQLPGSAGTDATAVTDASGRATLRVPAATTPDRYILRIRADGEARLEGQTAVVLQVQPTTPLPPPAAHAAAEPAESEVVPAAAEPEVVHAAAEPVEPDVADEPALALRQPAPSRTSVEREAAAATEEGPWLAAALGRGALETGDAPAAIDLYREATERAPDDARAWLGLGRALAASNRPREARQAFRRASMLDAAYAEEAEAELGRLPGIGPAVDLSIWGGASFEDAGTAELLAAEIGFRPVSALRTWFRYDGGVGINLPILVRGSGDPRALAGGVELTWGPEARLVSRFEMGRQEGVDGLLQLTYRGEQRIALAPDREASAVEVGAFLGRWYDRDDWLVHGRLHVPAVPGLSVRPGIAVGETVGTVAANRDRKPASEVRAELGLEVQPLRGFSFVPVASYGLVEDREDDETGSLLELRFLLQAELREDLQFQAFARHQRPPFSDAFTSVAGGFRMAIGPLP